MGRPSTGRDAALALLRQLQAEHGTPISAPYLAAALGQTGGAVRGYLYALQRLGLVEYLEPCGAWRCVEI